MTFESKVEEWLTVIRAEGGARLEQFLRLGFTSQ